MHRILGLTLAVALTATGGVGVTAAAASAASPVSFTPGDVVVYRVGDGANALTSAATAVFLDEYTPSGELVQSVPLPTATSGATHALTASGSAGSEGLLSLSADSRYLIAPGYAAALGTTKITSSASATTPRTIGRIAADGSVDTSTALTDAADGNNVRVAASPDGSSLYVGGAAGGPRYATLGASTSTSLDAANGKGTYKNVRQVSVVDGRLYASADPTKAGLTIATVGTGLPTTSGQTFTNLPFDSAPTDPYAFSLLTLGTGTAPDTLYEADSTNGQVVKYGLVDGTWTKEGSVSVPQITGLTANDADGAVTLYATSAGSDSTTGTISSITDDSGVGGRLAGVATTVATLPANEAARGIAFAPGTVIGTGGGVKPPVVKPTVTAADTALPAALGEKAHQTLDLTVSDGDADASDLTVTATSSNQSVAADAGITVSGSGASRTLAVTPLAKGTSTITLTVTAPDGQIGQTQIAYGVSADLSSIGSAVSYLSGAANASAAVDAGDGYAFVGDDESDTLRLYDMTTSGAPVASFDFDSLLPQGSTEIDIEGASKKGDVIYWEGSMSNSSSGKLAPARSTVFATRVSGTGSDATLTYLGSYTGILQDLVAWDHADGSGLGADALGLAASSADGVDGHASDALNVEGLEFASPTSDTAFLAFRAPLEPTTDRHLAMLIPVTNYSSLATSGNQTSTHATFGKPVYLDLGGFGIRDIKENAAGRFLIVAGTADDSNTGFSLWQWDGDPAHAPRKTGTTLPQVPTADNAGSWETIVSVPAALTAGAPVQLAQDDGTVDWYGDGLTSKTGEAQGLQKDLAATFSFTPPPPVATTTTVTSTAGTIAPHTAVTLTARVTGPADQATPAGSVTFTVTGADSSTVSCQDGASSPLVGGSATCVLPAGALHASGSAYVVRASYAGTADFAGSTGTTIETVNGIATRTSVVGLSILPSTSSPYALLAAVLPTRISSQSLAGPVTVTARTAAGSVIWSQKTQVSGILPLLTAVVPARTLPVGASTVTVAYAGNEYYARSTATVAVTLRR
jgi:hypothetical protein